jgi:hypothetical protein
MATLWMAADSGQRVAIRQAARIIDQRLAANAPAEGESRPHGRRILLEDPLAMLFRIRSDDVVRVLEIWSYK